MNWHPESHYRRNRFGVDSLIVLEVVALALIAFAAMVMEWI